MVRTGAFAQSRAVSLWRIGATSVIMAICLLPWLAGRAQAQAKPKEAIIIIQKPTDGAKNIAVHGSGQKLKQKLNGAGAEGGKDADTVVMGNHGLTGATDADGNPLPPKDIDTLDELQAHLKKKYGGACLKSIHFLQHGENEAGTIHFPPDKAGHPVVVQKDKPNKEDPPQSDPNAPAQFGVNDFNKLLHALLCPDSEVYLQSCYSAQSVGGASLAGTIADGTGHTVFGHTKQVQFEESCSPHPLDDDKLKAEKPTTPSSTFEEGVPKLGGGTGFSWDVKTNLQKAVCDVHIKLGPKANPKTISKFTVMAGGKPLAGWNGKITKTGDGSYLSWFAKDCAKNGRTTSFKVGVTYSGSSTDAAGGEVVFTRNGGETFKKDDIITEGKTQVPTFASVLPPERPLRPAEPARPLQPPSDGVPVGLDGGYFGASFGGGVGESRWNEPTGSTDPFRVSGMIGGVNVGYAFLSGSLMWGPEADLSFGNIHGNTTTNCAARCETSNTWMATARVRVGVVAGPGVLYVTGGVAAGNIKAEVGRFPGATSIRAGLVGGGGYEVPLGNQWRGKVEVVHAELGSGECTPAECGGIASIPFNATMVRLGLNLRLF